MRFVALPANLRNLRDLRAGPYDYGPSGNKDVARRTFAGLRELRDELEAAHPDLRLPELSCGMSEDFEPALEEGSTLVRLGRVVFSPEFAVK